MRKTGPDTASCTRAARPGSPLTTAAAGCPSAISSAWFGPDSTAKGVPGGSASAQAWESTRPVPGSRPLVRDRTPAPPGRRGARSAATCATARLGMAATMIDAASSAAGSSMCVTTTSSGSATSPR